MMLKQYKLILSSQEKAPSTISFGDAYYLYGALMEKIGSDCAEKLHSQEAAVTQYLTPLHNEGKMLWTVSLLNKENCPEVESCIEGSDNFFIASKGLKLKVAECKSVTVNSIDQLLDIPGSNRDCPRFHLRFITPSSFRVAGEYLLFPSVKHIIGSLVTRWGTAFPSKSIDDTKAIAALEAGVKITGYTLQSSYYPLKGNSIAAFTGSITLNAKLPAPLLHLLRGMLAFSIFSGIGIKTSLGMGGVQIKESPRQ